MVPDYHSRVMAGTKNRVATLIVDDHRTFGEALRIALEQEKDMTVVGVATSGEEGVSMAKQHRPDVVLMDIEMPGMDGVEAIRKVKSVNPEARVVVVSAHQGELIMARAVEAGAGGFLSKEIALSDVVASVRLAYQGESLMEADEVRRVLRHLRHRRAQEATEQQRIERVTPRETEILQLMADGVATDDIAQQLGVSPYTLRTHVQNILTKLGVHSKLEALAFAIRHGKVTANQ
jgi:DNA-binding NarL/FixJ family response regulator